jgi:hypothetical protein
VAKLKILKLRYRVKLVRQDSRLSSTDTWGLNGFKYVMPMQLCFTMTIKPKCAYENTRIYCICDKVISSYIFICTSWFYSHSLAPAHCHEMIPRAMLAVAYATGRASHARQVKGDDPDKKGYPGPPGWGFGVGLTTPHSKKLIVTKVEQRKVGWI